MCAVQVQPGSGPSKGKTNGFRSDLPTWAAQTATGARAAIEAVSRYHGGAPIRDTYRRVAERRGRNIGRVAAARKLLTSSTTGCEITRSAASIPVTTTWRRWREVRARPACRLVYRHDPQLGGSTQVIELSPAVAETLHAHHPRGAWRRDVQATEPDHLHPHQGARSKAPVTHHT